MVVKNIWKTLKTISLYTESTALIYKPSKKYPYRGSVPVAVEEVLLFIWGLDSWGFAPSSDYKNTEQVWLIQAFLSVSITYV